MTYVIHFQNVGNYPAMFVRISDYIPTTLELNTIEMVSSSHKVSSLTTEGRFVQLEFDNINLLDSASDETASHGFVEFRIKPSKSLLHGDSMVTMANIVFDFDGVISTNTVKTIYFNPSERAIEAFPNPVNSEGILEFKGDMSYPYNLSLYNCLGTKVAQENNLESSEMKLKALNLKAGMYIYQLNDQNGLLMTKGRVIVW